MLKLFKKVCCLVLVIGVLNSDKVVLDMKFVKCLVIKYLNRGIWFYGVLLIFLKWGWK